MPFHLDLEISNQRLLGRYICTKHFSSEFNLDINIENISIESLNYPDEGSEWLMFFSILLTLVLLSEAELLFSFNSLTNKGKERRGFSNSLFNLEAYLWTLSEALAGKSIKSRPRCIISLLSFCCFVHGKSWFCSENQNPLITVPTIHTGTFLVQSWGGNHTQAAIDCFRSWLSIKVFLDYLEKIICNRFHHNFCWGESTKRIFYPKRVSLHI